MEEALEQVTATVSETLQPEASAAAAVFKSGGVDLLDLMKEGLAKPGKIVNIRNIKGLDNIEYDDSKGLRLGANVTLAEIESHNLIKEKIPGPATGRRHMPVHLSFAIWPAWAAIWHNAPGAGIFGPLIIPVSEKGGVSVLPRHGEK